MIRYLRAAPVRAKVFGWYDEDAILAGSRSFSRSRRVGDWAVARQDSDSMHEVGIMEHTLAIALRRAADEGADRIRRLTMRIGPLSGVVPEALEFAFDVLARGTIAEGAELQVERVPIICYCPTCRREIAPADLFCECPQCQRVKAEVHQGRELGLATLEVS